MLDRSLRVVLASTGMVKLPPNRGGGVERYVCDLAEMLHQSGIPTSLVSDFRAGADFPGVDPVSVASPFDSFPLPGPLSTLSHIVSGIQVARSIRHLCANGGSKQNVVIHLNEEISAAITCRLLRDIPKIYTLHNPPVGLSDRRTPMVEASFRAGGSWLNRRFILDDVDRIIALNPALTKYLVTDWGIAPARVSSIPVPVDTRVYAPSGAGGEAPRHLRGPLG